MISYSAMKRTSLAVGEYFKVILNPVISTPLDSNRSTR